MYYFVRADKYDGKHKQETFYPGEEKEMFAWMKTLADYGWDTHMKEMNRNQRGEK